MSSAELLSKLTPKTQNYTGTGSGSSGLSWQDVVQALHGLDPAMTGFMLHVFGADPHAKSDFWAGLFIEAMQRPKVQSWTKLRRQEGYHGAVKMLCYLAVKEWGNGTTKFTHAIRARYMGVSRSTWNRKYRDIYQYIYSIPVYWQNEVERILKNRLR